MPVLQAPGIIHIEEYNQFLLERHLLRRWKAGQSAVVEMPVDQLFSKFPSDYFDKPRVAVVMIVPKDIYVTCGPQIPSEEMDIDSFHPAEYSTSLQDSGSVFSVGSQKWQ
jgi:hypothetical protein